MFKRTLLATNAIFTPITIVLSVAIFSGNSHANATYHEDLDKKNGEFEIGYKEINREEILEKFFEKYNSPLIENVDTFIEVADEYDIDYKLLPSISCIESGCGKLMPPNSYNAFGWGVYGNQYIAFESHDEAIETVGKGLNENYFARGFNTPEKIAPIYTPPNHVKWLQSVTFFSNQIDEITAEIS